MQVTGSIAGGACLPYTGPLIPVPVSVDGSCNSDGSASGTLTLDSATCSGGASATFPEVAMGVCNAVPVTIFGTPKTLYIMVTGC